MIAMPALVAGKKRRFGSFLGREFSDLRPRWAQVSVLMDGGTFFAGNRLRRETESVRAIIIQPDQLIRNKKGDLVGRLFKAKNK